MKKLSLVLAAALLMGTVSFAQTPAATTAPAAKTAPAKKAPAKKDAAKKGEHKAKKADKPAATPAK